MKKVAYATGSRADYGIVRNYLKFLNEDKEIELEILATGSIIAKEYGDAINLIKEDGFNISTIVDIELDSSSNKGILNSMSVALKKFGNYFFENKIDLLIILGDRYEMLSVAIAAAMQKIPILHIHGGEITYGNYDEFIRHSITKMSMYHFTSTEEYRNRVIQLGEEPNRVFNIGAMGSENCNLINMNNVSLNVKNMEDKNYFVVLFHPETLTDSSVEVQMIELLSALECFKDNFNIVFIGSNADTGSDVIRTMTLEFVKSNDNVHYYENLHPDSYHYLLKNSKALIGNSSSGIIEAPTLHTFTINIGDRQKGRVRGSSIIDTQCSKIEIIEAINTILKDVSNEKFTNPYYKENSSQYAYMFTKNLVNHPYDIKKFYDISIIENNANDEY